MFSLNWTDMKRDALIGLPLISIFLQRFVTFPGNSILKGDIIMATTLNTSIQVPITRHHLSRTRCMISGFLLYTLLILAGHIASFPLSYTYLHTVCSSGCGLTPDNGRALQQWGISIALYANFYTLLQVLYILICVGVALFIVFKKPGQWVPLGLSCFLVGLSASEGANYFMLAITYPALAFPLHILIGVGINILGMYALFTFPNGKFGPRWIVGCYLFNVITIFIPIGNNSFIINIISSTNFSLLLGTLLYRYHHHLNAKERVAMKWIIYSLSIFIPLTILVNGILPAIVPAQSLAFVVVNTMDFFGCGINIAGFLMAVLYANAFDIDVLISRTLVFTTLTIMVVGIYVFVVGYLGAALRIEGNQIISLITTGVIAVLFQPLQHRLQVGANRLVFGERDEPHRVLTRLGQQLEATISPETVLPMIVETVAHSLKLPYAAILWTSRNDATKSDIAAVYGEQQEAIAQTYVPLVYQKKVVGELLLAPRRRGETLTPADLRFLRNLAPQIGTIVHSAHLTANLKQLTIDLQHSREQLVSAREEERRRLRRDLHDGLGQQLSTQTLLLTTAQMVLREDLDEAEAILKSAVIQSQNAIADIRHLVYALRPPALDDLGLLTAIQEQMTQNAVSGVTFSLDVPEQLPPLPAAVEVACYRIVQEALTNIIRHAHAHHCHVCLTCAEHLSLEITDDGLGLPSSLRPGVGLASMRERVEELGGSWFIEPAPLGGTYIHAQLPLSL